MYTDDYLVKSNDSERSDLECATKEEADRICAKLNAKTDADTKFWVKPKDCCEFIDNYSGAVVLENQTIFSAYQKYMCGYIDSYDVVAGYFNGVQDE